VVQGTVKEVFAQPDKLREANIKPTQITRLAQALHAYGYRNDVTSFEEMYEEYVRISKAV
jgi:hypothetical protein